MLYRERQYTSDMSSQQWEIIRPLLSRQREGPGRPPELDLRRVADAIFCLDRTGCQWKNLPKDYPNFNSVYYYYGKWRDDGTWQRINEALRWQERERQGRAAEPLSKRPSLLIAKASRPPGPTASGAMTLARKSRAASGT